MRSTRASRALASGWLPWLALAALAALAGCERAEQLGLALGRASAPADVGGADMVRVEGGRFEAIDPHGVRRRVLVAGFWIDRREVTAGDFLRCVGAGRCRPHWSALGPECNFMQPDRAEHPMNCVSRRDAIDYCRYANKRLVTLPEWQLAASGGIRREPWGNEPDPDRERACWGRPGTCQVGGYPDGGTPSGILDLAGNVWELSDEVCAVRAPRPELCAGKTAAVHGGAFDSCSPDEPGCQPEDTSTLVERYEKVAPRAVGFRCAR